jgi:Short C-terminal domain
LEQQAVIVQPVPVPASPAPTAPASAVSIPEQLDQLATLHGQGTLSDDEFTTAKARLLSS